MQPDRRFGKFPSFNYDQLCAVGGVQSVIQLGRDTKGLNIDQITHAITGQIVGRKFVLHTTIHIPPLSPRRSNSA